MDACAIRAGECSSFVYAQYIQEHIPMDSSISKVHSSNVIKDFKSPMTLSVNMPLV